MNKILLTCLGLVLLAMPGVTELRAQTEDLDGTTIRIRNGNREAVVIVDDNPVGRDFLSLLPMSVTFQDYAGTEKVTYLPRKLETRNGIGADQAKGDFCYYAPWGNLAVFYKGYGHGNGLYILGRIQSGKEWLAGFRSPFTATIERMEN